MKKDINDFVHIVRQKNGQVKIMHTIANEGNIYKTLRDLGFGKSRLDGIRIHFRRDRANLIPVDMSDIRNAFRDFLEEKDFINIPDDVKFTQILEWFYHKRPIKENDLFNHYLNDNLTDKEILNFRFQRGW